MNTYAITYMHALKVYMKVYLHWQLALILSILILAILRLQEGD